MLQHGGPRSLLLLLAVHGSLRLGLSQLADLEKLEAGHMRGAVTKDTCVPVECDLQKPLDQQQKICFLVRCPFESEGERYARARRALDACTMCKLTVQGNSGLCVGQDAVWCAGQPVGQETPPTCSKKGSPVGMAFVTDCDGQEIYLAKDTASTEKLMTVMGEDSDFMPVEEEDDDVTPGVDQRPSPGETAKPSSPPHEPSPPWMPSKDDVIAGIIIMAILSVAVAAVLRCCCGQEKDSPSSRPSQLLPPPVSSSKRKSSSAGGARVEKTVELMVKALSDMDRMLSDLAAEGHRKSDRGSRGTFPVAPGSPISSRGSRGSALSAGLTVASPDLDGFLESPPRSPRGRGPVGSGGRDGPARGRGASEGQHSAGASQEDSVTLSGGAHARGGDSSPSSPGRGRSPSSASPVSQASALSPSSGPRSCLSQELGRGADRLPDARHVCFRSVISTMSPMASTQSEMSAASSMIPPRPFAAMLRTPSSPGRNLKLPPPGGTVPRGRASPLAQPGWDDMCGNLSGDSDPSQGWPVDSFDARGAEGPMAAAPSRDKELPKPVDTAAALILTSKGWRTVSVEEAETKALGGSIGGLSSTVRLLDEESTAKLAVAARAARQEARALDTLSEEADRSGEEACS